MDKIDAFHGSLVSHIDRFYKFSHFGTYKSALEVLLGKLTLDHEKGKPTIYKVRINVPLPLLEVNDFDSPEPLVWINRLAQDERLFCDTKEALTVKKALSKKCGSDSGNRVLRWQWMSSWLKEKGYGGFKYQNAHEDVGSFSYAIANPDCVFIELQSNPSPVELYDVFQSERSRAKYQHAVLPDWLLPDSIGGCSS